MKKQLNDENLEQVNGGANASEGFVPFIRSTTGEEPEVIDSVTVRRSSADGAVSPTVTDTIQHR